MLPSVHQGQRVHREGERRLREGSLHVGEQQGAGVFSVQLQDLVACIQTCVAHQSWHSLLQRSEWPESFSVIKVIFNALTGELVFMSFKIITSGVLR